MASPLFRLDDDSPALLGTRCSACDYCWFPANGFGCERCGAFGDRLVEAEFSGRGRLSAFTRVPDASGGFILGRIALDEGPVLRAIIAPDAGEEPAVGDRMEAFPVTTDGEPALRFRKARVQGA